VKLSGDLSSIRAATFLGGSGPDYNYSPVIVDSKGDIYVGGGTGSPDFPGVGPGSADSTFTTEGGKGYVAKLSSDLTAVLAATLLGTQVWPMALDSARNIYAAGGTNVHSSGPLGIGPGSADSTLAGLNEGFIAKLDPDLSSGPRIVNDRVSLVVQSTSLSSTPVPGGPAGVYTITARLTNKSQQNILVPISALVTRLTNANKLLSATSGDGAVGSLQAIDAGTDGILVPNESVTVRFQIGLANRNRFTFFVDIWGVVTGGQ
jgi:hypothetical protein